MKKVISLIVAAMMIMALIATPAFADDATVTGTITIQNAVEGNIYSIYQILDLESFQGSAFSYKVTDAWEAFFAAGGKGAPYISIGEGDYVSWIASEDAETVETFAKLALEYAKEKGIAPLKSSENAGEYEVTASGIVFEGLDLGYYLVDSSMGALCGLTTTATDAVITAKNAAPTLVKFVQEDSLTEQADGGWRTENTADIGQTISYMVSIDVHDGSENFVLHDKMDAGISFGEIIEIQHVIPGTGTHVTETSKYTVKTTDICEGCTFHIEFSPELCNDLNKNDKVVIYYNATLNTSAVIGSAGNVNTAWLTFGDKNADGTQDHKTAEDTTITRTWGVDIVKTTSTGQLLDGATFKLYNAAVAGEEIFVIFENGVYRPAVTEEEIAAAEEIVINAVEGKARVIGLDNGTYYLEEIEAPAGYNKLTARQAFTISDANFDAVTSGGSYVHSGVQVINKTGSVLPTTGGIGTTLFITLGGLAVLAAGVVLFAKKRMSQIAE